MAGVKNGEVPVFQIPERPVNLQAGTPFAACDGDLQCLALLCGTVSITLRSLFKRSLLTLLEGIHDRSAGLVGVHANSS